MLVGICGGSATGKSTVAKAVADKLAGCLISSDAYFKPAQQIVGFSRYRYDTPNAIDSWALQRDIASLLQGNAVNIPQYAMLLSKVTGYQTVNPCTAIVLEGLHWIANAQLRKLCDVIVVVKADPGAMLLRRVARDSQTRGRNFTTTVDNFYCNVLPAYQRFWQPLHSHADICVYNNTGEDLSLLLPCMFEKLLKLAPVDNLRVA